jgi:hypothetical protein
MYKLVVAGPYTERLAIYLAERQGWTIVEASQNTIMSGTIVGTHADPYDYVGFGDNSGTYIREIIKLDEYEL